MNPNYRIASSGQADTPASTPAVAPTDVPRFDDPSVPGWYLIRAFSPADALSGVAAFSDVPRVRETSEVIVRRAQLALNELAEDRRDEQGLVRNDGELDADTLRAAARAIERLTSDGTTLNPSAESVLNAVSQSMALASQTRRLEGVDGARAWSGIIAVSTPSVLSSSRQAVGAWLMRGGVRLGSSAQALAAKYPKVEAPSDIQRALPRTMNFVREYKYPLAIGGVAIVGLTAYYLYNREQA